MHRISTRLTIAFLIVALLPAVPLSLVVRNLLERRFGPSLSAPLEQAIESGLQESREHLVERKAKLQILVGDMADVFMSSNASLEQWSIKIADDKSSATTTGIWFAVLDSVGQPLPLHATSDFYQQNTSLKTQAPEPVWDPITHLAPLPVRVGGTLVTAVPITLAPNLAEGLPEVLLVCQDLPAGMLTRAQSLTRGLTLLRVVEKDKNRILLSFIAPFLVVYGLLITIGLITGNLWAKRIVKPLEQLVAATRRVGEGDLDSRVAVSAPGEVGDLVQAFDDMVGSLAAQHRELGRLERAAAWRGMARTLAHEVKNPLTPILLAVQEIRDKYQGDDKNYSALLEECCEIVSEEVDSLRKLVREFGDFARLPKPELHEADFISMVFDLGALYGSDRLVVTVDKDNLTGWFDYAAIRRSMINLIDNGLAACRSAHQTEQVTLDIKTLACGCQIQVSDKGSGIQKENLQLIFKPDFTTKGDGMGLGLAIVDSVVAGHGGTVSVVSTLGSGATFTICLPLTPTKQNTAEVIDQKDDLS